MGHFIFANVMLALLNFLIGIISPKFIGLECVLTFQLMYYSQLLINPWTKYPPGINSFYYLRYSNGYNDMISLSSYVPMKTIE